MPLQVIGKANCVAIVVVDQFTYPNEFLVTVGHRGSDNQGSTVPICVLKAVYCRHTDTHMHTCTCTCIIRWLYTCTGLYYVAVTHFWWKECWQRKWTAGRVRLRLHWLHFITWNTLALRNKHPIIIKWMCYYRILVATCTHVAHVLTCFVAQLSVPSCVQFFHDTL